MRAPTKTLVLARRLRREMSLPEVLLWQALRGGALASLRFRRQHPMGPFVLDFYCPTAKLAIEVDGAAHDGLEQASRDLRRDAWLAARGVRVLRVPASEILQKTAFESVLDTIAATAKEGRA